jgi:hypothetical protein
MQVGKRTGVHGSLDISRINMVAENINIDKKSFIQHGHIMLITTIFIWASYPYKSVNSTSTPHRPLDANIHVIGILTTLYRTLLP